MTNTKAEGQIKGYSDSRGIVDAEGKKVANVASTTKEMVSEDYFMVHPAFTADETYGGGFGNNNGSNDNGIRGIWIGKYETGIKIHFYSLFDAFRRPPFPWCGGGRCKS